MEIPLDLLVLFIVMTFLLFILTLIFLFIDPTIEKTTAALIMIMLNLVLCIVVALMFTNIDYYGFDSSGVAVHTGYDELNWMGAIWMGLFYINIMLIIYCAYLFYLKPWEEYERQPKISDQDFSV